MEPFLNGAYDLHIHTSPDVIPRKLDDEEMVLRGIASGMRGLVLKCHAAPTAGRAAGLKKRYPDFDVIGSLTLNRSVGGINPAAVEAAGKMGAKYLWFPTMDAMAYRTAQGKPTEGALSVKEADGRLSPAVFEVLELARQYDMTVGTGHIGTAEALCLADAARNMKLKRLCMTHVTLHVCQMTAAELAHAVSTGAMAEYSYCHILSGKCTLAYVFEQIRRIGAEHVILSSDLGQADNPFPDEGLAQFAASLQKLGITEKELKLMLKDNPRRLLYG